jgi:hypothetical protein
MAILSGVASEDGEGFIVLRTGTRIKVRSTVRPTDLVVGARVLVKAQLRGAEWVAEDVRVEG